MKIFRNVEIDVAANLGRCADERKAAAFHEPFLNVVPLDSRVIATDRRGRSA